jgi:hypothetical protein
MKLEGSVGILSEAEEARSEMWLLLIIPILPLRVMANRLDNDAAS